MKKLYSLIICLSIFYSCSNSSQQDASETNKTVQSIYPQQQINFVDSYDKLNDEIEKVKDNSVLWQEALDRRNNFGESLKTVDNWVATVGAANISYDGGLTIDCYGYKGKHYQLQFKPAPNDEVKKLRKGIKIKFSGISQGAYITDGTYSIIE